MLLGNRKRALSFIQQQQTSLANARILRFTVGLRCNFAKL